MEEVLNESQMIAALINVRVATCFFISIVLYVIALTVSRKQRVTRKNSDCKNVVSPILAEALVDGKIDIKNLILTTIAELQVKHNIAIVNDNVIELLHKNNLSLHEIYLVDMIFLDKKTITFDEINSRFIHARFSTADFVDSMHRISIEIQSKLYEMKVFSRTRTLILNFISYLAMIMLINFPVVILTTAKQGLYEFIVFSIIFSIIATVLFFARLFSNGDVVELLKLSVNPFGKKRYSFSGFIITEGILFLLMVINYEFSLISVIGVYIINFLTLNMAKNNVLSDKGLEERRKILELRNYLATHDFRKYENGESYIVWDEYFAYAAALGISNPVISDIYKTWNKVEMTLSFTKNII